MKVRFRGTVVTVYRRTKTYPFYRAAWRADGKRVVQTFKTLADAKKAAQTKARDLHAGNHVGTSLPKAAAHAYKFATAKLAQLCRDLDARTPDPAAPLSSLSLEEAITEYVEAKRALGPRRLIEAVTGFLGTVAQVRRVKVRAAVDEYHPLVHVFQGRGGIGANLGEAQRLPRATENRHPLQSRR
jgi:hypothetical protein